MTDFKLTELIMLKNLLLKRETVLKDLIKLSSNNKKFKESYEIELKDVQNLYYKILEIISEVDER